jgi:hypothetical protein
VIKLALKPSGLVESGGGLLPVIIFSSVLVHENKRVENRSNIVSCFILNKAINAQQTSKITFGLIIYASTQRNCDKSTELFQFLLKNYLFQSVHSGNEWHRNPAQRQEGQRL